MNLPTSRIGLVEGRHPRPDEPRTSCGWCGRPSPHPTCQTCDSLDRRAQPTDSHALPDGQWIKKGSIWHYVADPVQPRFNKCEQCGNRCRGQVCRDCWRARAHEDDPACADCGEACRGTYCRPCYLRNQTGAWTDKEAKRAHAAYVRGNTSEWARRGESAYSAARSMARRKAQRERESEAA